MVLGPILIVVIIALSWLDEVIGDRTGVPAVLMLPALLIVGILASTELSRIFQRCGIGVARRAVGTAVAAGFLASSLTPAEPARAMGFSGIGVVCTVSAVVLLGSLVFYSRDRQTEGVAAATGATLLAFVYLGLMGGFLIVLRREHSAWLVLGILLVTKSFDIGAFFTGRFFGRRKLIQWLSPGKTWEGLIGGLVVSSVVGAIGAWFVGLGGVHVVSDAVRLRVWEGAAMGFGFGLVGQAGDLFASLLKRDAGIKDAGQRLPGFGGVLDVIDSPIVVAPVAWWVFAALAKMG